MKQIYLDNAATTSVDPEILSVMLPYFSEKFGNPMSIHSFGQEAMEAVEKARRQLAEFLNADPSEIIFTSGATESNNFAIKGAIKKYNENGFCSRTAPHIIISSIEHHSVLDTCKFLEKSGRAEITYLPVNKDGIVEIEDIEKALRPNTILISIMYVNNEIGTVQPIEEIGELIRDYNSQLPDAASRILFHTDATQAVNYFSCDVKRLNSDMLSLSGHKIYGPKGIGALYIRKGTAIRRTQDGGDQEFRMRAGTHNVPGIVGLGKAIELISKNNDSEKIEELRDYCIEKVLERIPDSYLNGSKEKRSPNNINFRFDNVEGESLIMSLDMEGIAASTGSACSSGDLKPSYVLLSIGLKPEQAHGSLRLTLGKDTTKEEMDHVIDKLKEAVERLRNISGNVLKDFDQ